MATLLHTRDLVLPPPGLLPQIPDDPIRFYYRPLTAQLYRGRLRLARRLLGTERREALLDVGYGSGIFMPELVRVADRVVGVDIHGEEAAVARALARVGVLPQLEAASLYELPYAAGEFDALVSLSVLEHLSDLDGALREFRRVLRPGGVAVIGFPVRNPATDAFFRLAGYDPRSIHPSGHRDILRAARRAPAFHLAKEDRMPRFVPLGLAAYAAFRLEAV